jgi:hypothetical protein
MFGGFDIWPRWKAIAQHPRDQRFWLSLAGGQQRCLGGFDRFSG